MFLLVCYFNQNFSLNTFIILGTTSAWEATPRLLSTMSLSPNGGTTWTGSPSKPSTLSPPTAPSRGRSPTTGPTATIRDDCCFALLLAFGLVSVAPGGGHSQSNSCAGYKTRVKALAMDALPALASRFAPFHVFMYVVISGHLNVFSLYRTTLSCQSKGWVGADWGLALA